MVFRAMSSPKAASTAPDAAAAVPTAAAVPPAAAAAPIANGADAPATAKPRQVDLGTGRLRER